MSPSNPVHNDRLRVAQVDAAIRLAPISALLSAATVLVVIVSFWPDGHHVYLCGLLIAVEGMVAAIWFGGWRWKSAMPRTSVVPWVVKVAIAGAGAFGVLWASMPMVLFATGSTRSQLLVTGTVTGLVCSGVVVAPIARAALAFMLPIIAGSFVALAETGETFFLFIGALLSFYATFVCFSVIYLSRLFQERLTEQFQMEEQADTIRLLLWDFERTASDWLWQTDANGQLQRVSERFAGAIGTPSEHLGGASFLETLRTVQGGSGRSQPDVVDGLARCMRAREHFRNCVVQGRSGGKRRWWSFTGAPMFDDGGQFLGYRGVGSDVTVAKESEERIAHLASHDSLTGLPNRTSFQESLMLGFEGVVQDGRCFALLCLDLDGFKAVNDTFGHPAGDALLRAVAGRLRSCVRDQDRIARVGGDEFAVLHMGGDAPTTAALARRIIEHLGAPYQIDEIDVVIGVSIGVALAPENGVHLDQLVRNGDRALYEAKLAGRGVFQFCKT
jgi:diguanylate cyclase (GGDEF)-like protein/PAS domain S-box-containing protein